MACGDVRASDRVPRDMVVIQSTLLERTLEVGCLNSHYLLDVELPNFTYGPGLESGTRAEIWTYYDEWGCPFGDRQAGLKGEVKDAPIADWSALEACSSRSISWTKSILARWIPNAIRQRNSC